ncbi:MAG TPA: hypothetical protein VJ770_19240 [Stellaceae bacterium]|nr:hypothetical protein [Stellaceae bacterium]
MNRAQRRRQEAVERRQRAIQRQVTRQFFAEAAGLFTMQLIRPDSVPSPKIHHSINEWFRALYSGRLDPICLCCDDEFRDAPPAAFVITFPYRADASRLMLNALCAGCAGRPDADVIEAATDAWRRQMMPDLRRLPPEHLVHAAGRA